MTNQQIFTIFKGDTLLIDALYRRTDGTPVDLVAENVQISAYLKGRDNVDYPVNVQILPEIGHYRITGPTENWPLGRSTLVIRYNVSGIVRTPQPVAVEVQDV